MRLNKEMQDLFIIHAVRIICEHQHFRSSSSFVFDSPETNLIHFLTIFKINLLIIDDSKYNQLITAK